MNVGSEHAASIPVSSPLALPSSMERQARGSSRERQAGERRENSPGATGVVLFSRPGGSSAVNMTVNVPQTYDEVLARQVALQKSMDKLQKSQAEQDLLLQNLVGSHRPLPPPGSVQEPSLLVNIQQQLQDMKSSLVQEVESSKQELLSTSRKEFAAMHGYLEMLSKVSPSKPEADVDGSKVHNSNGEHDPPEVENGNDKEFQQLKETVAKHWHTNHRQQRPWEKSWMDFQMGARHEEEFSTVYQVLKARTEAKSIWHHLEDHCGVAFFWRQPPNNILVKLVLHPWFAVLQNLLIMSNTVLMGYEADYSIKALLAGREKLTHSWFPSLNRAINLVFVVELSIRVIAERSWFFVAPFEWGWNLFDFFVVQVSLMNDVMGGLGGINMNFIRMVRIGRAMRAVRVFRVLRLFRELRKILFGILASLRSLLWCFVFLALTMFMFSIFFLQGLVQALKEMEAGTARHEQAVRLTQDWFPSLLGSMFSICAAVSGGVDWLEVREPLIYAGSLYTGTFLIYVLFILMGVMNVLTGVFLASAEEYSDKNMVVQTEQLKTDRFVRHMLDIFMEIDMDGVGEIDFETFEKAMKDSTIQSYLAANQLEPTHARILFDLLDEEEKGRICVYDWVLGMVRLKGEAKAIDARIIQRELGMIPKMLCYFNHIPAANIETRM